MSNNRQNWKTLSIFLQEKSLEYYLYIFVKKEKVPVCIDEMLFLC